MRMARICGNRSRWSPIGSTHAKLVGDLAQRRDAWTAAAIAIGATPSSPSSGRGRDRRPGAGSWTSTGWRTGCSSRASGAAGGRTARRSSRSSRRARPLGTAPSRRKARRIGYLDGCRYYPLLSTVAVFELEIRDTVTGKLVRAHGAEIEAYHRARDLPTVGDVGYW